MLKREVPCKQQNTFNSGWLGRWGYYLTTGHAVTEGLQYIVVSNSTGQVNRSNLNACRRTAFTVVQPDEVTSMQHGAYLWIDHRAPKGVVSHRLQCLMRCDQPSPKCCVLRMEYAKYVRCVSSGKKRCLHPLV